MSQNKISVRLITRNDFSYTWLEKNPILLLGELGIENDTGLLKAGDGIHTWSELDYINQTNLIGDEKTVVIENNTISLKNWGKEYYAWIEPVGEEGEENYIAGHHQKQVVDEEHPWLAGLEPQTTTTTGGVIEIAWYQPSTITVEGINSTITSIQNTVTNLTAGIGSIEDEAGAETVYGTINEIKKENENLEQVIAGMLPLAGGTVSGDIILKDNSIAASEAVVDTKIASAISSAGHLKREIVDEIPDAATADADTIYMVPNQTGSYDEYIKINDKMELIGSTQVDLTSYMKKVEGAVANNFAMLNANGEVIDGALNASSFVSTSSFETYKNEVNEDLENKTNIVEGALLGPAGEEVNIDENKKLILPIAGALLGLVKSSNSLDKIKVEADGTMSINQVSASKLYVSEDEELILSGGSAN